jgi:hypothetical protein
MKAGLGLAGLIITVAIGYMIYSSQLQQSANEMPLTQQASSIAVRSDLLSLGKAEKLYWAANGSYASLEQLQSSKVMSPVPSGRAGYDYSIEIDGAAHFRITAVPTTPASPDLPTISIDETLQWAVVSGQ